MHIYVCQHRANISTLYGSFIRIFIFLIDHNTRSQILLYQPQDIGVFDMPFQESHHPFMVDVVEEAFYVGIHDVVYLSV